MIKQRKTKIIVFLFTVIAALALWMIFAPYEEIVMKETIRSDAMYKDG